MSKPQSQFFNPPCYNFLWICYKDIHFLFLKDSEDGSETEEAEKKLREKALKSMKKQREQTSDHSDS